MSDLCPRLQERTEEEKSMKFIFKFIAVLLAALSLAGCDSEAYKVSHNVSKEADNFNVTRRVTVINTRTDKVLLQMTGKISIQDVSNGMAIIVEIDRDRGIYQKHYVYLNENTMYTVEDITGVSVSRYAYEMEFMPQAIAPVKITANELKQDVFGTDNTDEGKADHE